MDPKVLEKTLADYNAYRAKGHDDAFGRPDMPLAVAKAPFYAVEVAPGIHHTMGGVAVTTESEVLDIQSRPMPGLYAAGEVTGGVHGFNRLGGNAVADTVVFGRRAGEHAAKYARSNRSERSCPQHKRQDGISCRRLRKTPADENEGAVRGL